MFSEAQTLYLEEVLGVRPGQYVASSMQSAPALAGVAVRTGARGPEEDALLRKILASVQLRDPAIFETWPAELEAFHRLQFDGELPSGRHETPEGVEWNMPSLAAMTGNSPQVTENKKRAWALLQMLAKEIQ